MSKSPAAKPAASKKAIYRDSKRPLKDRVRDLVGRMTLKEKVSQMLHDAPEIPRLGVPAYNWWNECLHGVGRAGLATVFPQAIGMAASFNTELLHSAACAISDEARAKHHEALRLGHHGIYQGLTFWTPNINIFRDPRWGRGQETYGEDPYLTARMGVAFVKGLQGNHPKYLKLVATAKHYAVHSGPERDRHTFDARVGKKDLYETYLPAFETLVREARVASVMGAYNRTNGEVCCGSKTLLQEILRKEWGFEGYVVSDCGAIDDFHMHHKVTQTAPESAALAVRNGCELNCGATYPALLEAVEKGLIYEDEISAAVEKLFEYRFRLGMFDPPAMVPFAKIKPNVVNSPQHRKLALQMARESIVLLKNEGNVLPLRKDLCSILVTGPNAASTEVLLGNYHGLNSSMVTVLQGITERVSAGTAVQYAPGCLLAGASKLGFGPARWVGTQADVIVAVMGLSPFFEGEEGDAWFSEQNGDRVNIGLPGVQEEFLQELSKIGKPIVLVLMSGSAVAIPWAQQNIAAIVQAWYPGQDGGTAVADVLFGDYNPAGRLPVTFPADLEQLPPFEEYSMHNRTYRYMQTQPLYPFGFGLSYTKFAYNGIKLSAKKLKSGDSVKLKVNVKNAGPRDGDEVVQVYVKDVKASVLVPKHSLVSFARVSLKKGKQKSVEFTLGPEAFALVDAQGQRRVEAGDFEIFVGGGQPGTGAPGAGARLTMTNGM
jgi:beta-glucosidase